MASVAPRPTNWRRWGFRRTFFLSAVIAHRRRKSQAKAPSASQGPRDRMLCQRMVAPRSARAPILRSTCGDCGQRPGAPRPKCRTPNPAQGRTFPIFLDRPRKLRLSSAGLGVELARFASVFPWQASGSLGHRSARVWWDVVGGDAKFCFRKSNHALAHPSQATIRSHHSSRHQY